MRPHWPVMFGKVTRLLNRWGSVDVLWPGCTWYRQRLDLFDFPSTGWDFGNQFRWITFFVPWNSSWTLPSSWVLGERHVLNFSFPSAESETEDQKQSFWHALCGAIPNEVMEFGAPIMWLDAVGWCGGLLTYDPPWLSFTTDWQQMSTWQKAASTDMQDRITQVIELTGGRQNAWCKIMWIIIWYNIMSLYVYIYIYQMIDVFYD